MTKIRLEVEKLRNGAQCIRPAGTLGTCGWSPKAWEIAWVDRRRKPDPIATFLEVNRNWKREEIAA